MISGPDLSAWLADPARQGGATQAAAALAARWRAHPLMTALRAELAAMPAKTAPAVLAAAERFMARRDEIALLVREMLAASAADPFFNPPFLAVTSEINKRLLLYGDPWLTITLGVTSADALAAKKSGAARPRSIAFTGLLTSFHWLKAGNATLSFWEAPPAGPDFSAELAERCRLVARRKIADGESFIMDGGCESFVIEHATSELICLQAAVHVDAAPLSMEYDSRTLGYVGASSSDEVASRTEMMATLLRLLDRDDAVPDLLGLLDSPHFYTRWHIMREFLALDAEAVLPALRNMAAADPHPEIRAAAAQTLHSCFAPEEVAA